MGFQVTVELTFAEDGARHAAQLGAVTVVVDALRASATTVTALALGAAGVIPVLSVEDARAYLGRAAHCVAGERHGVKVVDFDFGNSPSELARSGRLAGKTLVLSTSNGTRMVSAARAGAAALFMGTTLNARAVAEATWTMARAQRRPIVIVSAGEYDVHAEEDDCGARCIAAHLHALGALCPPHALRDECSHTVFHATPSAQELRDLGYADDIDFCAQRDRFAIAPLLVDSRFIPFRAELMTAVA